MKYVVSIVLDDGTKLYRTRKNLESRNAFTKNINDAFIFSPKMNDYIYTKNYLTPSAMNLSRAANFGKYKYDGVEFCISQVAKVSKEQIQLNVTILGVVSEERLDSVP